MTLPSLHLFSGLRGPSTVGAVAVLSSNSVTWSFPHSVRFADGYLSRSSVKCSRYRSQADLVVQNARSGGRPTVRDTDEDHTLADDTSDAADNQQVYVGTM